jgi:delta24-sterol reductase
MLRHRTEVAVIAAQVRELYHRQEAFRINHGSTNSTRQSVFERKRTIDISHLKYVLNVNVESRTVLVEPNVPMDRLAETTLKYGLIPPVVMEFPGITVGGGYAGTSGESSSFKYGFFDRTINYVEMILADGEIVTASRTERADLFHGAAGACGSLGITTLVELQLIEAKKYVETTYHPVASMPAAVERIQQFTKAEDYYDYVDGILFSKDQGAIITGRLTNERANDNAVRTFSHAEDPWFYLHVRETITNNHGSVTEYIPLDEYLFRYDRGGFWVGISAFQYFFTPFNRFTRWYLDKYLRTRMLYTALHASRHAKPYVVQDLALPMAAATEFVEFTEKTFGIYPLWLCPLRQSASPTFHPHISENTVDGRLQKPMLNIGLWGYGPGKHNAFMRANHALESELRKLGGMKWLYAQVYYSEKDFWEIYDREWYDNLRQKYNATSLPSVYEKVRVDVEVETKAVKSSWWLWSLSFWPISGFWSLWKAKASRQYLLADKTSWRSIEEKHRKDSG